MVTLVSVRIVSLVISPGGLVVAVIIPAVIFRFLIIPVIRVPIASVTP